MMECRQRLYHLLEVDKPSQSRGLRRLRKPHRVLLGLRLELFFWCGDLSFPVSAAGQPEPEPKRFHSDQFFGDVVMLMSQEEEEQSVRRCLGRQQPGGCERPGHPTARENAFAQLRRERGELHRWWHNRGAHVE